MKDKKIFSYIELGFDLIYLILGFIISILIFIKGNIKIKNLAGIMGMILIFGDSFHLIPRMKKILSKENKSFQKSLGIGKLITSITMTIFYLFLWHIGIKLFKIENNLIFTRIIYILAIIRIVLCLIPQNKWTEKNPPVKWGIIRNIPFTLEGIMVIIIYFINRNIFLEIKFMWLAILLSFAFYIPVVLFSNKKPMVGMLMLPKTIMYLWILWILLSIK